MNEAKHVPVMLNRVRELLAPALNTPGAVVVDATLGLGGHAEALLRDFKDLQLIGIDRDPDALSTARERLLSFGDRVHCAQAVYDDIARVVADAGYEAVDAVLFDLGVSSMQLDLVDRGFSYSQDAPLDMRMGKAGDLTAASVLNSYSGAELSRILRVYGEERFAGRIADAIVTARANQPFSTSARLADLVRDAIPAAARRTGGNPAKRTFQALRIEVNDELGSLTAALPMALETLGLGGRIIVMAYHSLEDRIVKHALAKVTSSAVPPDMPVVPASMEPKYRLLTRGSEQASTEEVDLNRRARSVRLRAAERIAA